MDFKRAKSVGDGGEQQVAQALERIAPRYGMHVLNNVLLEIDRETAQIDHIVVDRYGVLIIESKVRQGALIKGRDVEHRWTACYTKRNTKTFQNPLKQNDQHAAVLRRVLQAAGRTLDPDYVRSLVVFVGAKIDDLELDSLNRARVIDISELESFIQYRHDFAPNAGNLDVRGVAALADMIRERDKSGDADVLRMHADRARGRRRRRVVDAEEPLVWNEAGFAPRVAERSQARVRSRGAATLRSRVTDFVARLALVGLAGLLFWWLFLGPGYPLMVEYLRSSLSRMGDSPVATPATPVPVVGPSVEQAKAVLAQTAPPSILSNLSNPDSPKVESVPQGTRFTWEYVEVQGNTATPKTISITLDASGQMVGADIR